MYLGSHSHLGIIVVHLPVVVQLLVVYIDVHADLGFSVSAVSCADCAVLDKSSQLYLTSTSQVHFYASILHQLKISCSYFVE